MPHGYAVNEMTEKTSGAMEGVNPMVIRSLLDTQEKMLHSLSEGISLLEDKIGTVLRPEDENKMSDRDVPGDPSFSPLANRINVHNDQLAYQAQRLGQLIDRVQL